MAEHHIVGREGEDVAMRHLLITGYSLLGRNVRIQHDEIDLIVLDPVDGVIVFAEVKSRNKEDPDFVPGLNFTEDKKACVRRAAERWIAAQEREWGWRIDLVLVADGKVVDHIKDVGN
jgi:putative endonuclease